jgi:hypothetical protein
VRVVNHAVYHGDDVLADGHDYPSIREAQSAFGHGNSKGAATNVVPLLSCFHPMTTGGRP